MARRRPIITVQPYGERSFYKPAESAMIRLRGKWVKDLFEPYTQLVVTREERRGQIVLVLEPVYWSDGIQSGESHPTLGGVTQIHSAE